MSANKRIKSKKFTTKMKKKLLVIYLTIGFLLVFLTIQLFRINLKKGEDYSKSVYDNFTYDSRPIPARRGDITDRNGTILAYSTKVYNLIIDSKVMLSEEEYRQPTVEALAKHFPELDINALNDFLNENASKDKKSSYKRFLQELSSKDVEAFEEEMKASKNIKGVWFEAEYKRTYPFASLASDFIGFSSKNNGGEIGVESVYEKFLAGVDGRQYGYIDESEYKSQVIPAINGSTIVTTIDYSIQNIIENAIKEFNDEYGSLTTTVVVMNPKNGEILGMADYPTFDLNNPRDISSAYTQEELDKMTEKEKVEAYYSIWSNNSVSKIFEPGSVFKTFTIAELIEEDLIDLKDVFICDGYGVYNSSKILCHGGVGHEELTVTGALGQSCNDCLMQFGDILGKRMFSKYLDVFKFGQKTGIDLPSEEAGILIAEDGMMDVDLATNTFGQNLNVNMVQMMANFASIINGGYYYTPHVVKEILNDAGEVIEDVEPELVTKTVSEETSAIMRSMLRAVVDYGTGGYVYMDGYSIGGKTGAAEKIPRDKKSYIVSFMGFAPAEDPEVLVYVTIDTPKVEEYDTSWAAQLVSKAIMEELVPYLGIPADNPDYEREVYLDTETFDPVVKRGSAVDKDNISSDSADSLPPDADGDGIPDEVPELPTESETSGESEQPSETETEPPAEPPSETETEPPAETNPEPPAETLAEQEPPTEPES